MPIFSPACAASIVPTVKRALVLLLVAACSGDIAGGHDEPPDAAGEPVDAPQGSGSGSAMGSVSVQRAEQWVAAKLQYCQAPNHERDYDAACASTCERKDNAAWDPYRSDCSGLVSWAWKLPAPGRVTTQFAPFKTDITHAIQATNLEPGDAVNNVDHIMLFKKWVTHPTRAVFIEEPGCSSSTPYAHEVTENVTISGTTINVPGHAPFTAIRYPQAP
jgi:hypothetical protein